MKKYLFLLPMFTLGVLLFNGCAALQPPKTALWEPTTSFGIEFKKKYNVEFNNMISELRTNSSLGDVIGMLVKGVGADSSASYFGVNLGSYNTYNKLRTNFEERAATALTENMLFIFKAIGKQKAALYDPHIRGAFFGLAWTAGNFTSSYELATAQEQEAVFIYVDRDLLEDFLSFKITNQELMNKAIVIGSKNNSITGRIQFNMNKNF